MKPKVPTIQHRGPTGRALKKLFGVAATAGILGTLILMVAGTAYAGKGPTSINNGGGTPSCGNSCDSSGNPTDFHKPCTPVPGNGCHTLPDTPCERGHGNAEEHNKHCAGPPVLNAQVYLAYVDNLHSAHPLPTPWQGSSGVTFEGCGLDPTDTACVNSGGRYDAGAIRIDNLSADPLVVSGASVTIAGCANPYTPWPGLNDTIPSGGTLILTQTGGKDPCGVNAITGNYNLDTSDSRLAGVCTVVGAPTPVVSLTLNGTPTSFNDTGRVLNTGGVDTHNCATTNESTAGWILGPLLT